MRKRSPSLKRGWGCGFGVGWGRGCVFGLFWVGSQGGVFFLFFVLGGFFFGGFFFCWLGWGGWLVVLGSPAPVLDRHSFDTFLRLSAKRLRSCSRAGIEASSFVSASFQSGRRFLWRPKRLNTYRVDPSFRVAFLRNGTYCESAVDLKALGIEGNSITSTRRFLPSSFVLPPPSSFRGPPLPISPAIASNMLSFRARLFKKVPMGQGTSTPRSHKNEADRATASRDLLIFCE